MSNTKTEKTIGIEDLSEEELETEESKEELDLVFPKIEGKEYIEGIGRRKTATARVRIFNPTSKRDFDITINERNYENYFLNQEFIKVVNAPLRKLKALGVYKVKIKVYGGGKRGQAEASRLGLARALVKLNPEWRPLLKKAGFLTRDARVVERKKYGKRKARKEEQWSKR